MHMTFHTYRTIKRSLMQTLQVRSGGHQEQHINTLALLICGIVGAQHVQFDKLASHAPIRGRKNESLITRGASLSIRTLPPRRCGCRSRARCSKDWPRRP